MLLIGWGQYEEKQDQRQLKNIHSTSHKGENGGVIKKKSDIGVRSWFGGGGELNF